ncbi:MAG: Ig-like domain-containing protein, partial [Reinekea sp.]
EVTISNNNTIQFTNFDHLASLSPDDYLTMRLYSNEDAGNIVWEYAFEYLYIESAEIGYDLQTDNVYYVNADNPVVDLKATMLGYAYRDTKRKKPFRVHWWADGSGSFSNPIQDSGDTGMFDSTLIMNTTKGSTAQVQLEVINDSSTAPVVWKKVEVLAGAPHHIEFTRIGNAIALGQGDVQVIVKVFDQFNNLVEDGTEVDFSFSDSLIVRQQDLSTTNGEASILLTGGEYAVASTDLVVNSGKASKSVPLTVEDLSVTMSASNTTLSKQQTVSVTATVTKRDGSPVEGVPVSFVASKGLFKTPDVETDSTGTARVSFTAGLNDIEDKWFAQVGYVASAELSYSVSTAGDSINALDAMLVADEIDAGVITYDHYGIESTIGYETSGELGVTVDSPTTLTIGDMADPNLEPLVALSMNNLTSLSGQNYFLDAHQLNNGVVENVAIVQDHPLGAGRSAALNSTSKITITGNSIFNLPDNIGMRLDVKPLGDGMILNHGQITQTLQFKNGRFVFGVRTDQGSYSVQSDVTATGKWHRVATRMSNGQLELYVDSQLYSRPVAGELDYTSVTDITFGELDAVMRGFRLYDWSSAMLISFADNTTTKPLTTGSHTVTVQSLGHLGDLLPDSLLESIRVAVITGSGERNYVSLLSKLGYRSVAMQYLNTISPESPVALQAMDNPFDGWIDTAQAWSWDSVWEKAKSAISFVIPYEDFISIGQQLVYLMDKDWENFDPVTLAFASLGAATVIPIESWA